MEIGVLLRVMVAVMLFTGPFASIARAEVQSPLTKVKALGLDTMNIGRVAVYFSPADREYAEQLAALTEEAAAYFDRELGGAHFPLRLAVLTQEDWFDPYARGGPGPYGMPWGWVKDLLMTVPASLEEGVLIFGSDDEGNRRRVQFVLLHEFGHLANKQHLHPETPRPYSSVRWFEEFLATFFAYAYVRAHDAEWAEASRIEWFEYVRGYTPDVLSLDWGFMRDLPPEELARTYAWYQVFLNLQVADLYDEHGLEFLRTVRDRLPWEESGTWTTEFLLPALEEIAPGFEAWSENLQGGDYLRDGSTIDEAH